MSLINAVPQQQILWRYSLVTGNWHPVRICDPKNAAAWLQIFQDDEPGVDFRLEKTRPGRKPLGR